MKNSSPESFISSGPVDQVHTSSIKSRSISPPWISYTQVHSNTGQNDISQYQMNFRYLKVLQVPKSTLGT